MDLRLNLGVEPGCVIIEEELRLGVRTPPGPSSYFSEYHDVLVLLLINDSKPLWTC